MSSKFVSYSLLTLELSKPRVSRDLRGVNMSLPLPPRKVGTFSANCWIWVVIDIKPKYSLVSVDLLVSIGFVAERFSYFLLYIYI